MISNPLVCFANVYDCEPAIEGFNSLPCDRLRLDYFEYPNQFTEAQAFFLKNKQYTHFIYLAPDVVIDADQFNQIKDVVDEKDYDVYGPVCNVDQGKYKDKLACCVNLPAIDYESRLYRFVQEEVRQYYLEHDINILKVKFNSITFAFIKREIMEKYQLCTLPFNTDALPIWKIRGGWACDLAFAHYCDYSKIDMFVDLRVKLKHLRYYSKNMAGFKKEKITFISYNNK